MAEYTVVFARSARRELERLEAGVARRIILRVASETTASSSRSTTTRASWTSALYDTEAMLTGSGGSHAPNHGIQPTAFGRG